LQVLQGDHGARVRVDAVQRHTDIPCFKVSDAILAAGSILLEKVSSKRRANLAEAGASRNSLILQRYSSINDEGSRQFLPRALRHGQLLPGTLCAPSRQRGAGRLLTAVRRIGLTP
jgi:hypothetical protein